MILTDQERERFAQYLEEDSESTDQLLHAAETAHFPPPVLAKLHAEAAAARHIAARLRATERVTL